jgi:hypothetical protein
MFFEFPWMFSTFQFCLIFLKFWPEKNRSMRLLGSKLRFFGTKTCFSNFSRVWPCRCALSLVPGALCFSVPQCCPPLCLAFFIIQSKLGGSYVTWSYVGVPTSRANWRKMDIPGRIGE